MNTLSEPTLAILISAGGHWSESPTKEDLKTLLSRVGIPNRGPDATKQAILRRALLPARERAEDGDKQAHKSLLEFVRRFVERKCPDPGNPPAWLEEFTDALLVDGYQLRWEHEPDPDPFTRGSSHLTLVPTDAEPVALAPEITALEADLDARGYHDALRHYRQAIDNFTQHNYEAANGALRTMLEAVVMLLAEDHTGYVGGGKSGEGGLAINHLQAGALPENDGGLFLRGLWKMIQTNGPHPGQSNADEARFRLQVGTATARFLLNRFPANS